MSRYIPMTYRVHPRDPVPPGDPEVLARMLSADALMQLSAMSARPDYVPGYAHRARLRALRLIGFHNEITETGRQVLNVKLEIA
jgi:hypothetical protein